MSYDRLAESVRLLEGGPPASDARLSRRVRRLPLAVDRDGDVAATMFLRRGVSGIAEVDVHSLELVGGAWRLLGGGSGPGDFAGVPRPALADLPAPAESRGGGGTARSGPLGWDRSRWVWWAELRVAREVAELLVNGERRIPVAAHGLGLVVWTDRRPEIAALDAAGALLGVVTLPERRAMPEAYRDDDEPR